MPILRYRTGESERHRDTGVLAAGPRFVVGAIELTVRDVADIKYAPKVGIGCGSYVANCYLIPECGRQVVMHGASRCRGREGEVSYAWDSNSCLGKH